MEAEVLFEYESTQEDELSLQVGEIIHNVREVDDGWCEGELRGRTGMFPDNFVRLKPVANVPPPVHHQPPPSDTSSSSIPLRNLDSGKKSRRAKVSFSYTADNTDELTLQPGQIVEVLEEEEEGWWKGRIGNREGVFPSNFVEEISAEEEPPKAQSVRHTSPDPSPPAEPDKGPLNGETDGGFKPPPSSGVRGPMVMPSFDPSSARAKLKKAAVGPPLEKPPEHKKAAPPPTQSQPTKPAEKPVEQAKVTFDYEADNEDELTIRVGEVVDIINRDVPEQEGWWEVSLKGRIGLIPDNFVEPLPIQAPAPLPSPPQPKKPAPPQINKEPLPTKQPVHPPPATKPLKKTEPKKPPAPAPVEPKRPPAPAPSKPVEEDPAADFPVPKTVPLDTSAIKDRPKHKNRPPSRSNLLANHDAETPTEESAPAPEPAAPSDSKVLSPWQAELMAKKKQPKLAPKPAPGKPKPLAVSREAHAPLARLNSVERAARPDHPVPRSRLNSNKDREVTKPDPPPMARTRVSTGGVKEPPAPAKHTPASAPKPEPPGPAKHTVAPATKAAPLKPTQPTKPVETKPHPPQDTPSQSEPPAPIPAASQVVVADNLWKEAYEKLREDFEKFKEHVNRQIDILTDDLDKERKHRAGMDIDIDRIKKAQRSLP